MHASTYRQPNHRHLSTTDICLPQTLQPQTPVYHRRLNDRHLSTTDASTTDSCLPSTDTCLPQTRHINLYSREEKNKLQDRVDCIMTRTNQLQPGVIDLCLRVSVFGCLCVGACVWGCVCVCVCVSGQHTQLLGFDEYVCMHMHTQAHTHLLETRPCAHTRTHTHATFQ